MVRASNDTGLLQAALFGYEVQKGRLDEKIRELQALLKGDKAPAVAVKTGKVRVRREMSDAARARIAAAQKRRWAEFHKKKATDANPGA